ncbi:MAG: NADP-dependent isocitrate dehydrogenase, partial [Leptospiraceae bacterium]|nr:NADP-dependent isocitrate dehydrogenase [Leptospiraceae bacterium]
KSLNVTLRKSFGLFANIRPVKSYPHLIPGPEMNLVIVRENEEDTYAGIEHRQTAEVTQCLKLITRPGTDKILHYAFALTTQSNRKKLTLMCKDNIMKLTDGVFSRRFTEIGTEFLQVDKESMIIDIGAAKLAKDPGRFDVIVAPNLYGDILSDIAAEISGSVGLCGSANLGSSFAMFEAVHGSAPDIAGSGIANPSGLLHAAIMMLHYHGQSATAHKIESAWNKALEDGFRTADIYNGEQDQKKVTTKEFAQAVIERLDNCEIKNYDSVILPDVSKSIEYAAEHPAGKEITQKELTGVDIFLDWSIGNRDPEILGNALTKASPDEWNLKMITNRGVKVYPNGIPDTFCTDHWRCRFILKNTANPATIPHLMIALQNAGFEIIKTENLYSFDGEAGYSMGQGE